MKGVPAGYNHNWKYRINWSEEKLPSGAWAVESLGTKSRAVPTTYEGNFKIGSSLKWQLNMTQEVIKISHNTYSLYMAGIKTYVPRSFKPK